MTATNPSASPPIEPMLAKVAQELPASEGFLFEPKWDGLRALVFSNKDGINIQGRDKKPLNRYFPELERALFEVLPKGCVLDGEIVVSGDKGLDFDALQARIHPSTTRVALLAKKTPASFVAFDLLCAGGKSTMALPQAQRRVRLERFLAAAKPPLYLTPMTRDRAVAQDWLDRFEGAGLDGVMAKPEALPYTPAKRALFKIKHERTADCVVAGFRFYKDREDAVGSLLLGLYDELGVLQHMGSASTFTMEQRVALLEELAPLRKDALKNHPWANWGEPQAHEEERQPGARSRSAAGKDLRWEALRPERAAEVKYDQLQGDRFRNAATFVRWRDDKPAAQCRYGQLETVGAAELQAMFAARSNKR
ncbi:ATP-dependent DNA ligase [Caenimonas koreensis]|uniref:ATP-dependent DNA ligase n=1 Tax=Caenimonas koreensis TaxID=367474 RepID=UPI003783B98B